MNVVDVVQNFKTIPFLFVGSGMSRRYYGLPDWEGLLSHFAQIVSTDEFIYNSYLSKAEGEICKNGLLPKVAELIQRDFDQKWFRDSSIRTLNEKELDFVKRGVSPFKVEIAAYIRRMCIEKEAMSEEIALLEQISKHSIAGVITTNYDRFLEDHLNGFNTYIGQNQLVFSTLQGVAEIYKIHGSIDSPDTIVINDVDYSNFNQKSAYLAAKLMTIFVENPIIFMGYSISDKNIQGI
ncbi:MAG: SIR2 family protein, partial [Eubacteriales bacterium]|nr:SIR2 family protein [Eubacteriales bacterium]